MGASATHWTGISPSNHRNVWQRCFMLFNFTQDLLLASWEQHPSPHQATGPSLDMGSSPPEPGNSWINGRISLEQWRDSPGKSWWINTAKLVMIKRVWGWFLMLIFMVGDAKIEPFNYPTKVYTHVVHASCRWSACFLAMTLENCDKAVDSSSSSGDGFLLGLPHWWTNIRGYPEIRVPLVIIHSNRIFPYKPSIFGYPQFRKPLYSYNILQA